MGQFEVGVMSAELGINLVVDKYRKVILYFYLRNHVTDDFTDKIVDLPKNWGDELPKRK